MSTQGQNATFPPLETLVKPSQISTIVAIPPGEKERYTIVVKTLWDKIHNLTPEHADYLDAYKKLVDISNRIKNMMTKLKQQTTQHAFPQNANTPQFSEQITGQVRNLKIIPPQQYWSRPEDGQVWVREMRMKYAMQLQRNEQAESMLRDLTLEYQARQAQGKPLSAEEMANLTARRNHLSQGIRTNRESISQFKKQQEQLRAQQQQVLSEGGAHRPDVTGGLGDGAGENVSQNQEGHGPPSNSQSLPVDSQALVTEGARPPASQAGRPSINPSASAPSGQLPTSQTQIPQPNLPSANVSTTQGATSSINTSAVVPPNSQSDHSPQNTSSTSQGPHPLSHKAAMAQAARSYSQSNIPQSTSQSSGPHPNLGNSNQPNSKPNLFIPKTLNVTPLQPVPMGSARPTLSGGPSTGALGPMGQPGIQKHPGYVLEGEGERVLSKKKLEELVRQVTGGGDGEGGETLDPDVEETLLDVADEFVDNVILAACRLAKLRKSATLELRDIQLILERNYNIRVPGYASDELRTVKKIQPTQAWTQKMSAVQAAKVTGGKADP